jgi:hypothetical protein
MHYSESASLVPAMATWQNSTLNSSPAEKPIGWTIAWQYATASLVGSAAGILLENLYLRDTEIAFFGALAPVVLTAMLQAFALRGSVSRLWWIVLTPVGRLGFTLVWFEYYYFYRRDELLGIPYEGPLAIFSSEVLFMMIMFAAFAGLLFGSIQACLLRRSYTGLIYWIAATTLGAAIAWAQLLYLVWATFPAVGELISTVFNSHSIPALLQAAAFATLMREKAHKVPTPPTL